MAWKTVQYKLSSSAPLIMHNGQMADQTNKFTKLVKQITSKKVKTDADHEEIAHLQFLGSLYLDENGPLIPSYVIDAVVINGAKKSKEGQTAKSGCFCLQHAKLDYDGPRTAEELWEDESFHFPFLVRIGQNKVLSTRVIFKEWNAIIALNIEDRTVNVSRVDQWLTDAGNQVGVGDWRPQYGRFTVERMNGKK